ncbi:hypothetical protein MASR2M48_15870 [Spirochaetota bacterium]
MPSCDTLYHMMASRFLKLTRPRTTGAAVLPLALFMACMTGGNLAAQESSTALNASDINQIDRAMMFAYEGRMDAASDYTQYASLLVPGVFALAAPTSDWPKVVAMYAGSAALSFATRTILKASIDRERPYMYFPDPPAGAIQDGDYLDSFPSGHTIMACTGAGFTAALFWLRYPDSPYRVPAIIGAYALAGTTVFLRLGSGSHFLSDVGAGALIGSIFGFGVPFLVDRLGWLD